MLPKRNEPEPRARHHTAADFIRNRLGKLQRLAGRHIAEIARGNSSPETVHAVRVTARRIRSLLRMWRPLLPAAAREAADAAREVMCELGALRDLDVMTDRLGRYQDELAPEHAAALEPILRSLASRRSGMAARATRRLSGKTGAALRLALDQLQGANPRDWPREAQLTLRAACDPLLKRVWREFWDALKRARRKPGARRCHALRIAGKRLRYALEPFDKMYGDPVREVLKCLQVMQDDLGGFLDARNGAKSMRELRAGRDAAAHRALQAVGTLFHDEACVSQAALPARFEATDKLRWSYVKRSIRGEPS